MDVGGIVFNASVIKEMLLVFFQSKKFSCLFLRHFNVKLKDLDFLSHSCLNCNFEFFLLDLSKICSLLCASLACCITMGRFVCIFQLRSKVSLPH